VVMVLENNGYPHDIRVRNEAEALVRAGHAVTVIAPREPGQIRREIVGGVAVRRVRIPAADGSVTGILREYAVAHVTLTAAAIGALVRGADVVHLHNPPDTLFVIGLVARALRRRVVFDLHDLAPELFAAKFGSGPVERLLVGAQVAAMRTAHHVVTTNETQRDLALARGRKAPSAVSVVRNGPRRETLGVRHVPRPGALADPRLVYVGTLDVQDGVLELPELLGAPRLAGAHLTVVGDGPARRQLEAALADRRMTDRVTFTGRIPHARVPELIAAADIAIDPAPATPLNHGSTMIKIAEYLAAGTPVVAYGLEETARTALGAALLAPGGDAGAFTDRVAELAADPALRAELARAAGARAEALVWEHSEAVLRGLYATL
jgi:glycosyltransferase involved in cell wall biosynthesis